MLYNILTNIIANMSKQKKDYISNFSNSINNVKI